MHSGYTIVEALELNQQIQQSQQQGSNSSSSDMFQLPPGIISGVTSPVQEPLAGPTAAEFTPMEESSVTHSGTGTNHNTPNLTQESFTIEADGAVSRKNSFTLNQSSFGQESLDTVHTPILDSKVESMYTDPDKHENSLDLNVEPFAGSSSDFTDQTIMDTTFNQLKPEEQFHVTSYDVATTVDQTESNTNIVSQFLQNMALKTSDPMLCGNQTLMSTRVLQNNTIVTSASNQSVMAAEPRKTTSSSVTGGSLLKEVLTCPPASLEGFGTYTLQNTHSNSTAFTPKVDSPALMDMDVQLDSLKSMLQSENEKQNQNNNTLGYHRSSKDSMDFSTGSLCQESAETIDLTRETSPGHVTQTVTPFSPEQIVPTQPSLSPFSPSEVLTTYSEQVWLVISIIISFSYKFNSNSVM